MVYAHQNKNAGILQNGSSQQPNNSFAQSTHFTNSFKDYGDSYNQFQTPPPNTFTNSFRCFSYDNLTELPSDGRRSAPPDLVHRINLESKKALSISSSTSQSPTASSSSTSTTSPLSPATKPSLPTYRDVVMSKNQESASNLPSMPRSSKVNGTSPTSSSSSGRSSSAPHQHPSQPLEEKTGKTIENVSDLHFGTFKSSASSSTPKQLISTKSCPIIFGTFDPSSLLVSTNPSSTPFTSTTANFNGLNTSTTTKLPLLTSSTHQSQSSKSELLNQNVHNTLFFTKVASIMASLAPKSGKIWNVCSTCNNPVRHCCGHTVLTTVLSQPPHP